MGIIAKQVSKTFGQPPEQVLKDISLEIEDGEFVALTGKSGSGKSTLLYLLSSLDDVSSGTVEVSGKNLRDLTPQELCLFRNQHMGFVFQFHYLISELTALENVLLPTKKTGALKEHMDLAKDLLTRFGLGKKFDRLPRQLSGGEEQRVAIARALVMRPPYLFADEPTGSLDSANGKIVMDILKDTNQKHKTTIIMVTHDEDYAAMAGRRIYLQDGQVISAENSRVLHPRKD